MHSLYISQHLKQECHTHFFFEYSHALELILERQCPNTGTHTVRGEWKLGISAGGRPKKSRQDPSVKKLDAQMSVAFVLHQRVGASLPRRKNYLDTSPSCFGSTLHVFINQSIPQILL